MAKSGLPKIALIDGSGFIFRAFHALPSLTKKDGTEVNAVYGFTKMVMNLIESLAVDYVAVIFDAARETFRNEIYKEYKAHRPPAPPELIPQFALIRDAVVALNVACIEKIGFEADDLIATYATLAKKEGWEVVIVSSDKDLMQLVEDPHTYMFDSVKKKYIKEAEVIEKFGVTPKQLIHAQALIGDSADNVPGVRGLGPKTAALLINQFGDLHNILANVKQIDKDSVKNKLIEGKDNALLSLELVTLKQDVTVDVPLHDLKTKAVNPYLLYSFLEQQEFKSLAANIAQKHKLDLSNLASKNSDQMQQANLSLNENQNISLINVETNTETANALIGIANYQNNLSSEAVSARNNGNDTIENNSTNTTIKQKYCFQIITNKQQLIEVSAKLKLAINVCCSFNGNVFSLVDEHNCVYLIVFNNGNAATDLFSNSDEDAINTNITADDLKDLLLPIMLDQSINKISYNIKKLRYFLYNIGINEINSINDIELMQYVLNGAIENNTTFADIVEQSLLCKPESIEEELSLNITQSDLRTLLQESLCVKQMYNLLNTRLVFEKVKYVYEVIDKPLIDVLYNVEQNGVLISPNILVELGKDIALQIAKLEQEIYALAGEEFNIGSPKQIGDLLFIKLGVKGKKNKTGSWKTDVNYLEELEASGVIIAGLIINWRKLTKLKNTYIEVLPKHMNSVTGRIHTSLLQTSTSTGRLSSLEPNLQNIPIKSELGRKIRGAFIAKAGYQIISLDYSQIELRILADIANIDSLINAFKNNEDIHNTTAKEIFNLEGEISSEYRRKAKTINFGIIYGISEFGLAKRLQLSREEAKRYINIYFQRYPEILTYMEAAKEEARQFGYVLTTFGRKCFVPNINHKNHGIRSFAERAAINAKLQGTAADIIRLAMIKCNRYLAENNLDAKLVLQIHDELLIEAKADIAESVAQELCKIMENIGNFTVPLVVNYAVGSNWLLAH